MAIAKKKIRICEICKREILPEDNYVQVIDYKAGEFYCEGFYHNKCYQDRLKAPINAKYLMKYATNLMGRANKQLKKLENGGEEVEWKPTTFKSSQHI